MSLLRLVLMTGLFLPLIAVAAPARAPHEAHQFYLPLAIQTSLNIGGLVVEGAGPAVGVSIHLRRFTVSGSVLTAATTTNAVGRYDFANVPRLPLGQVYAVMFVNSDPSRLLWWQTPRFEPAKSGPNVTVGTFSVAGLTQTVPDPSAVVSLPYTFHWTPRPGLPQDDYWFQISGSVGHSSGNLGYASSYQLASLPAGAACGPTTNYHWLISITWPDGSVGTQYNDRQVFINQPCAFNLRGALRLP